MASQTPQLVLAMIRGYPAADWVWDRTGLSGPGCYPEYRGTHQVRGRVRTGQWFRFTIPTTLAPIMNLSFHRIVT